MKFTRRGFIRSTSALALALGLGGSTLPTLAREQPTSPASAEARPGAAGTTLDLGLWKPWSFGVMGDTQWTCPTDPAGANPNGVAVSIISQVNQQFIDRGVKFVIQVGDLTEDGNDADVATRAAAAQQLYDAGIGFFPMRGNHETYASPANDYAIPAFRSSFPQTRGLGNTFGARSFSSPTSVSSDLTGMSYSFDFGVPGNDARFVVIDDWATPGKLVAAAGYSYGYSVADQQAWIDSRLARRNRGTLHAFVFSHQNLMGENHQDSLFDGYTNANPDMQNAFFASLQKNGIRYYVSGHDHMHQRSIVTSPDGLSRVEELICGSNSSKFYTPKALTDAKWYEQKARETSVYQELYTVGFYIFTVWGTFLTVDYYSDDHGNWKSDASYPSGPTGAGSQITPTFNFVKKETWGYSLNGEQFLVGGTGSASYTSVQDSFLGTSARILSGAYANTAADYSARLLTQTVDTEWKPGLDPRLVSSILTLVGMAPLSTGPTATYTLSMSSRLAGNGTLMGARAAVATRDASGNWVAAVDRNFGGTKQFVAGPWQPSYGLGTYGVDPRTNTAWAVLNYAADFAIAQGVR